MFKDLVCGMDRNPDQTKASAFMSLDVRVNDPGIVAVIGKR